VPGAVAVLLAAAAARELPSAIDSSSTCASARTR
jgi:hypothetical protein